MKENKKIEYNHMCFIVNKCFWYIAEIVVFSREHTKIYADNEPITSHRDRCVTIKRKYSLTRRGAEKKLVKLHKKMNKKYPILRGENE